jgi:transcriptional regulator with XRE-family HTH domain
MKDFAARIRKIRNAKEYSQEYVSMQLGITMSAYSKIERGITDPSLSRMIQIAAILEFELADFSPFKASNEMPNWEEESKFQEYGFVTRKEFAEYVKVVSELQAKLNEIQNKLSQ